MFPPYPQEFQGIFPLKQEDDLFHLKMIFYKRKEEYTLLVYKRIGNLKINSKLNKSVGIG